MKALFAVLAVLAGVAVCQGWIITVPADFRTIQAAIDAARDGDTTVVIRPGTYTGSGNRDIDFKGKAITVRSTDPNDWAVVAATVIDCQGSERDPHRGFYFHTGEDANSVLDGLTITNGSAWDGGGIWCRRSSSPTIRNCIIRGNLALHDPGFPGVATSGGGIYISESSPIIDNCRLLDNIATADGGAICSYAGSASVINCVISGNEASFWGGGGIALFDDNSSIRNCIITNNHAIDILGTWGVGGGIFCDDSNATIINCTISGNRADRRGGGIYVRGSDASVTNTILWENNAYEGSEIGLRYAWFGPASLTISYSDVRGGAEEVYIDSRCTLNWGPGNLDTDPCFAEVGYWVDANDPNVIVEPNDPNAFWIDGDCHLKSQAGRWDPNERGWTMDDVTSPCIDAGDPMTPIGYEPFPNGGIVNMGAYGGTAEASKSYFGEPPCETIVAGDINGDCKIDFRDFRLMVLHWLEDHN